MTKKRLDKILLQADLFYKAFPADEETVNHRVIKQVVPCIKRIMEYRGHTHGYSALPQKLLEMRYEEMYNELQTLRDRVDREGNAHREALRAIDDAEDLLDHVFV